MRATIVVSEPWEFASLAGNERVTGVVEALAAQMARLRLDAAVSIRGQAMTVAEVTPRHVGHAFRIPCTATPANIVFRADGHAGWYAAIGTLTLE